MTDRSWLSDFEQWAHLRHHHTSAAPAAATAPTAAPTEEHMSSLLDELHSLENKIVTVGEDAIEKIGVIKSTPEGAELIDVAHRIVTAVLAGHVAPVTLTGALAGLRTVGELVQGYVTAHEQAAAQQQAEAQPA